MTEIEDLTEFMNLTEIEDLTEMEKFTRFKDLNVSQYFTDCGKWTDFEDLPEFSKPYISLIDISGSWDAIAFKSKGCPK